MRKLKLEELGRLDRIGYQSADKIPITVILDNIRSGMNVGSFFRTSDAYRIERIVLCGITARPPHKEILKTAIGATDTVTWSYTQEVAEAATQAKSEGYHLIGIEQTDESTRLAHYEVSTDKKYALVFGNEVNGLSAELLSLLDECVEIAQYGTKHSLNVSVCGGVVLWHFATPYYR